MKLLLDENISHKLTERIGLAFPETKHIRHFDLEGKEDKAIFEFARDNNFCIVTFDEDFNNLSLLKGYPPKIIWLRTGNTSTKMLAQLLISKQSVITKFLSSDEYKDIGCLEIY